MRMKHLCLMTALFMLVAQASALLADASLGQADDEWQWRMLASASNGSSGYDYWYATIGARPLATDGYDGEPLITSWDIPTTYAAIFHAEEPGKWGASTGFYRVDNVGLLAPGETKSWQIYVWSTPDVPAGCDTTHFVMNRMDNPAVPTSFRFRLKLVSKPESISSGPRAGTVWSSDVIPFDVELPTYRTGNGLTGYHFEMTATAVPEPSSLLALFAGFVTVGGLIRRRTR